MGPATSNFYRQKTDDELLFFVQHPAQYAPELVAGAAQELRQRGALPPPAAPEFVPYAPAPAGPSEAPPRAWARPVALGLVVLLIGGGGYWLKQSNDAETAAAQARAAAKRRLPPPRLVTEATHALPTYDAAVARAIDQQLRPVPAAERANAQHLRQFRELAKRFWTAETQTEYLTDKAYAGPVGPEFGNQVQAARETWQAWNHANAYGFRFGPAMQAQLQRMKDAAANQQHILDNLPALLPGRRFLTDNEMTKRTADVQDLVGGLLPVSPASGRPYQRLVLEGNTAR